MKGVEKFVVELPPGIAIDHRLRQYILKGSSNYGLQCKHWVVRTAGGNEEVFLDGEISGNDA